MEATRENDMNKILELNKSICDMYDKLADLETQGKTETDDYNMFIDLIKFASMKNEETMMKYPLSDEDMEDFLEELRWGTKGHVVYDGDIFYKFYDLEDDMTGRRFLEHNYELAMIHHDTEDIRDAFNDWIKDEIEEENIAYADFIEDDEEDDEDWMDEDDDDEDEELDEIDEQEQRKMYLGEEVYQGRLEIEAHTFMKYLCDAIRGEQDQEIKEYLIRTKYKIIAHVRALENTFLYNPSFDVSLDRYKDRLINVFREDPNSFSIYNQGKEEIIDEALDLIILREKKEYKNKKDKAEDILKSIVLRTRITTTPNELIRDSIIEDKKRSIRQARSRIDKKVLKRAYNINKKYIVDYNHKAI